MSVLHADIQELFRAQLTEPSVVDHKMTCTSWKEGGRKKITENEGSINSCIFMNTGCTNTHEI